ncbi:MAG: acetylxylan esterase [Deltaproteobacteria bacterium]|nr:acetylxylan esterase [Deltaproteobacteria bacterium]
MYKNKIILTMLFLFISINTIAQMPKVDWEAIQKENARDHALMMKMLGISEIRPGPSGDPKAPNAANSDESKATSYTTLPDPLLFNDGTKVTTPGEWEKRKKELFELFDREVYGRMPVNIPPVKWEIVEEKANTVEGIPVIERELKGHVDNSSYPSITVDIQMKLTTPVNAKNIPVVIEFGWIGPMFFNMPDSPKPTWQEQLLKKGWGYAILVPTSIQDDSGAGLTKGIIGLVNKGNVRKPDDWGALRAWAWGAGRAIDYFATIDEVDETRVVIEGLSRYGKAALVSMAYEPRIAIGFIGSSGAGGAKILRRNFGEQVENLAASGEYHWFAPNFIKYAGPLTANDLPVDAHELVALCAPRAIFISAGSATEEGTWVDAKGMFLSGVHASPVYELLGRNGLETDQFPPEKTSLIKGDIAFRQHEGGHTVIPNWPYFIEFAERYFSGKR